MDLNATQAAIRAGYSGKTAYAIGQQNLKKVEIQNAIQTAMEKRSQRVEITQDMVLDELAAIGFARGTDYAQTTENGVALTPTSELNDRQRAAVVSVKETQFGVEIKLADKVKALELLGKHLGLFDGKGDTGGAAVAEFLRAVRPSPEAVAALFADGEDGDDDAEDSGV